MDSGVNADTVTQRGCPMRWSFDAAMKSRQPLPNSLLRESNCILEHTDFNKRFCAGTGLPSYEGPKGSQL